jgi:hypothetical protein
MVDRLIIISPDTRTCSARRRFVSSALASMMRTHSFFCTISCRMWRSAERSATKCLSFEFSSRNCLSLRSSLRAQRRVLLLANVERPFADSMLVADIGHSRTAFSLAQRPQDLIFRMSLLGHPRVLLPALQRTTLGAANSTYRWLAFRVFGQT